MISSQVSTDTPAHMRGLLRRRIARLRYITGFVTAYGDECDPRISIFARFWHVKRVADVARRLGRLAGPLDARRVERLAWIHDLNRWPFAHNSERGLFDQAANVNDYFAGVPGVSEQDIQDLMGIHAKDPTRLSDEARIVLFADSLAGIIEDPLLAIAGLNVHPRFIPEEVEGMLGFSLRDGRRFDSCRELALEFHGRRVTQVGRFETRMHSLFYELVEEFLSVHKAKDLDGDYPALFSTARRVKETFMRPIIFPLNNERVCHSTWLRREVFPWYIHRAGGQVGRLLEIDEREFVAEVTEAPDSPFEPGQFLPDLGVVSRELPSMAFIR
jgi:hypothetical protein